MPRGKLHYESYEENGELVEHWLDPYGNEHTEITILDDDDCDTGCSACGNSNYPECKSSCPLFDE